MPSFLFSAVSNTRKSNNQHNQWPTYLHWRGLEALQSFWHRRRRVSTHYGHVVHQPGTQGGFLLVRHPGLCLLSLRGKRKWENMSCHGSKDDDGRIIYPRTVACWKVSRLKSLQLRRVLLKSKIPFQGQLDT